MLSRFPFTDAGCKRDVLVNKLKKKKKKREVLTLYFNFQMYGSSSQINDQSTLVTQIHIEVHITLMAIIDFTC